MRVERGKADEVFAGVCQGMGSEKLFEPALDGWGTLYH